MQAKFALHFVCGLHTLLSVIQFIASVIIASTTLIVYGSIVILLNCYFINVVINKWSRILHVFFFLYLIFGIMSIVIFSASLISFLFVEEMSLSAALLDGAIYSFLTVIFSFLIAFFCHQYLMELNFYSKVEPVALNKEQSTPFGCNFHEVNLGELSNSNP